MQKFLVKLFIKNHQNTTDPIVRGKYGTLAGIVGIISNLILCAIKILLGILSASVSIMADGINNLTDAGSSIITLIGFKLSSAPADSDHPFGHERIEQVTGLIISFIIILIGFTLGKESIEKIISIINNGSSDNEIELLTIIIMIISIAIKFWQSIFYRKMAKAINSEALIASSKDSLNDCISTSAVIVGLILIKLTSLPIIDGIIGVGVALFIVISGIKMVIETINPLIGTMPTDEEIEMISKNILKYDGIVGIHDLVVHQYGNCTKFITVHAEVPSHVDVVKSHDIIDNIERDFRNELGIDLTIHMDPIDLLNPKTQELKHDVYKIIKEISNELSMHDFRVVYGDTHTNLLFDVAMPMKFKFTPSELRGIICEKVKELDNSFYAVIQIDQLYNRKTDD